MGAIKDLTDLTIKLLEIKGARKIAPQIAQIQVLTATIQSEQAAIVEKYTDSQVRLIDAQTENLRLAKRNAELEAQLQGIKPDPGDEAMCVGS